jgi:hypothetical protein
MIRVTTSFTRPNESTPYYMDTNLDLKDRKETFVIECGLIKSFKKDETDPLVQKIIVDFENEFVLNKFLQLWNEKFPTAISERDEYSARNNIKIERKEEIIN